MQSLFIYLFILLRQKQASIPSWLIFLFLFVCFKHETYCTILLFKTNGLKKILCIIYNILCITQFASISFWTYTSIMSFKIKTAWKNTHLHTLMHISWQRTLDRYGESAGVWGDCLYCDSLNSERISYSCLETSDLILFSYSPTKAIHIHFLHSLFPFTLSHSLLLVVSFSTQHHQTFVHSLAYHHSKAPSQVFPNVFHTL